MAKIFLIDGSGFLYRAYYAFPSMPDSDGHNINMVYGFFRMVIKLFFEKPEYFVIARDSPKKTHRHEIYPEYKANRTKAPDDFKVQIPMVCEITEKLGIPNIVMPGYEADDIIASLVMKYKKTPNMVCNIFSGDKDLKQLLDENVIFTDPSKGIQYNTADFTTEHGFEPKNILDYLSLIGDSVDNIKGVDGIGAKGASKLIQKYGNLDKIYENIENIGSSLREKLINGKESAYKAKSLISLENIPEQELPDIQWCKLGIDFTKYRKILLEECSFGSMEKVITDLKNKYQMPQQNSLFG